MSLLMKALKQAERRHQEIAAVANGADTVAATLAATMPAAPPVTVATPPATPPARASFESMTLAIQEDPAPRARAATDAAADASIGGPPAMGEPRRASLDFAPLDADASAGASRQAAAPAAAPTRLDLASPIARDVGVGVEPATVPENRSAQASHARIATQPHDLPAFATAPGPQADPADARSNGALEQAPSTSGHSALRRYGIWIGAAVGVLCVAAWLALEMYGGLQPIQAVHAPVSPVSPVSPGAPATSAAGETSDVAPMGASNAPQASNSAADDTATRSAGLGDTKTADAAMAADASMATASPIPPAASQGVDARRTAPAAAPAAGAATAAAARAPRAPTVAPDAAPKRPQAATAPTARRASEARRQASTIRTPATAGTTAPAGQAATASRVETPAAQRVATPPPARADDADGRPIRLTRVESKHERVARSLDAGYAALAAGDDAAALRAYEAAVQLDRNSADAWVGLASVATRAADPARASRYYARALEIDPSHVAAQAGMLSLRGGADPVADESRIRTMIAQAGASPSLLYALGNALAAQRRWPDAQQAYFGAASGDPAQPDYAFNLAVSLDRLRQPKVALDYYRRALRLARNRTHRFDTASADQRVAELQRALAAAQADGADATPSASAGTTAAAH
ncbi:MAG: tetratricopeptide repeat protein [Lautropia sp.]